jgi:hypothetical protein
MARVGQRHQVLEILEIHSCDPIYEAMAIDTVYQNHRYYQIL